MKTTFARLEFVLFLEQVEWKNNLMNRRYTINNDFFLMGTLAKVKQRTIRYRMKHTKTNLGITRMDIFHRVRARDAGRALGFIMDHFSISITNSWEKTTNRWNHLKNFLSRRFLHCARGLCLRQEEADKRNGCRKLPWINLIDVNSRQNIQ